MNKRSVFKRRTLIYISRFLVVVLVVFSANLNAWTAHAANLTTLSDNLDNLKTGATANHVIEFVTPTGIAAGTTVIFTFGSPAFTVAAMTLANYKFFTGSTGVCSSASWTNQPLQAGPDTSHWGFTSTGNAITLVGETSVATSLTTAKCVKLVIGNDAANDNPSGAAMITNGSTAADPTATLSITGTFGDTGAAFIPLLTNDQVIITATVNPTLTFTMSQTALGFGTLSASATRWATVGGGSGSATPGLVLIASTNGAAGYTIYVVGATLTDNDISKTIPAMGTSAVPSVGTPQFGLNGVVTTAGSGTPTISSPYGTAGQYAYTATATAQTPVATTTAPDSGTTYSISYVADISAVTPAGTYTTTHTWTATGNF
jgi:hypothetical protein